MTTKPELRVLFFDVFGTCVAQRGPVADELWKAAQEALNSDVSSKTMNSDVRNKAMQMTYEDWFEIGGDWNRAEDDFVHESISKHDKVDWRIVDQRRIASLPRLLARRGLVIVPEPTSTTGLQVGEGSLWSEAQMEHLARVWHRLTPWPDTCEGLNLLNKKFYTVALSNTYNELLKGLVAHSNIPFTHVFSSDMFDSYKPNSKVYLSAAEKMGVKPEECALVAAHLGDLKAAKACGFKALSVERPLEEKSPELRRENIPDLSIGEDEKGLIALAGRLGIKAD